MAKKQKPQALQIPTDVKQEEILSAVSGDELSDIVARICAREDKGFHAKCDSGEDLEKEKKKLGHGKFEEWVEDDLKILPLRTAQLYMSAAKFRATWKNENFSLLGETSLFQLSRPNVPARTIRQAFKEAADGRVQVAWVKDLVSGALKALASKGQAEKDATAKKKAEEEAALEIKAKAAAEKAEETRVAAQAANVDVQKVSSPPTAEASPPDEPDLASEPGTKAELEVEADAEPSQQADPASGSASTDDEAEEVDELEVDPEESEPTVEELNELRGLIFAIAGPHLASHAEVCARLRKLPDEGWAEAVFGDVGIRFYKHLKAAS